MPTVSVKLNEEIRQRLGRAAAGRGVTPHALMVEAIESTVSQAEAESDFVARALQSREQVLAGGLVFDGPAYAEYLKAKVRGREAARPQAQTLESLLNRTR